MLKGIRVFGWPVKEKEDSVQVTTSLTNTERLRELQNKLLKNGDLSDAERDELDALAHRVDRN